MTPIEIQEEMNRIILVLQEKLTQIVPLSVTMANAQKDYRIKLASEIIKLRASGEKVSLSEIIAKGNIDVANLKVAHVVAEAHRQACQKSIAVNMSVADTLRSLLKASKDEDISAKKNYYD